MAEKQQDPFEQLLVMINQVLTMSKSQEETAKLFAESAEKINKQDQAFLASSEKLLAETQNLVRRIPDVAVKYWAMEGKTKGFLMLLLITASCFFAGGWYVSINYDTERLKDQDLDISNLKIEVEYLRSNNPKSAKKFDDIYRKK